MLLGINGFLKMKNREGIVREKQDIDGRVAPNEVMFGNEIGEVDLEPGIVSEASIPPTMRPLHDHIGHGCCKTHPSIEKSVDDER